MNQNNTCDDELEALVWSYYIIAFIKNFNEVVTPLIMPLIQKWIKRKMYKYDPNDSEAFLALIRIEKQADWSNYQFKEIDGTYFDYLEIVIQQGYVILFSTAF